MGSGAATVAAGSGGGQSDERATVSENRMPNLLWTALRFDVSEAVQCLVAKIVTNFQSSGAVVRCSESCATQPRQFAEP